MEDRQDAIDRSMTPGMRNVRGSATTQLPPKLPDNRKLKEKMKVLDWSEDIEGQSFKPLEGTEDVESTSSSGAVWQSAYSYGDVQETEYDAGSEEGHRTQASREVQQEYPDTLQHSQALGRETQPMTRGLSNRMSEDSSSGYYSLGLSNSSSESSPKQDPQELEPKDGIALNDNTFALKTRAVILILGVIAMFTIFKVLAVPLWKKFMGH